MRYLIPHIDPSLWTLMSSGVFLLTFAALIAWVYMPSRKKFYEKNSRLPINQDEVL